MRKLLLLLPIAALPLEGAQPAWWNEILEDPEAPADLSENYAPANLGQLKHVALQARAHLDQNLPGGAGFTISDLWSEVPIEENYSPVNVGQLKAIAKPFYDRLQVFGYDSQQNLRDRGLEGWLWYYPWPGDGSVPPEENYHPANIGQLKMVFSFDAAIDTTGNGLPDLWSLHYFGTTQVDPGDDPDGDGLTNLEEFELGSDPTDYYNGVLPAISIAGGDHQTVFIGSVSLPLSVLVERDGAELDNAPVDFTIESPGEGELLDGMEPHFPSVEVRTNNQGHAEVYYAAVGENVVAGELTIRASATSDGMVVYQDFTIAVAEAPGANGLFAGPNQSFLIDGGSIAGMGDDRFGQISGASELNDIVKIAAGRDHTIALSAGGEAYVWGDNFSGQLGLGIGNFEARTDGTLVPGFEGETVLDIAVGDGFSCLLVSNGTANPQVFLAGDLSGGLLDGTNLTASYSLMPAFGLSPVVELAADGRRVLARCEDGSVWAWGDNRFGQANPSDARLILTEPSQVIDGGAIGIDASPDLSLALIEDGETLTLVAWGNSSFGQINEISSAADAVEIIGDTINISAYAAGNGFIAYVTDDGTLYTGGLNDHGQLGRETAGILAAPSISVVADAIAEISAGDRHVVYLTDAGVLHGFGDSRRGALPTID